MNDALTIAGVLAATIILATLTITLGRMAWHALWASISTRIETHMAFALERPLPHRYRDLDTEYRALVLAEHNKNDE